MPARRRRRREDDGLQETEVLLHVDDRDTEHRAVGGDERQEDSQYLVHFISQGLHQKFDAGDRRGDNHHQRLAGHLEDPVAEMPHEDDHRRCHQPGDHQPRDANAQDFAEQDLGPQQHQACLDVKLCFHRLT